MKNLKLNDFIRQVQSKPKLKKKLIAIVGVGFVGLLLAATLTIYLGVVGVGYVARNTEALKSKVEGIPAISTAECISTAQGLFSLEKLLSTPVMDNFNILKQACFDGVIHQSDSVKESESI